MIILYVTLWILGSLITTPFIMKAFCKGSYRIHLSEFIFYLVFSLIIWPFLLIIFIGVWLYELGEFKFECSEKSCSKTWQGKFYKWVNK